MINTSTFVQQRSFGYTWLAAVGSAINIPSGVITGISLVSTDDHDIAVSKIAVTDDGLSVTLTQDGKPFASVLTQAENSIVQMEATGNCISALLTTGGFMASRFSFTPSKPQYIRRSFLTTTTNTIPHVLNLKVNGEEYTFDANIPLAVDTQYLVPSVSDGTLTLSLTEDAHKAFQPDDDDVIVLDDGLLYSINGVSPNAAGELTISAYTEEATIQLSSQSPSCIGVYSTLDPCEQEDIIDRVLSPLNASNYTNLPLNDAYTKNADGSYTRDYLNNLVGVKGSPEEVQDLLSLVASGTKKYGDPKVGLFELEPTHDKLEE